jgi:hypothetical protein
VTIPYNWRTKNPFKSIYFAALAGAGELSTGSLALSAISALGDVSLLVTGIKAEYYKKATGEIRFVCEQGRDVQDTLEVVIKSKQPAQLTMMSTGYNAESEVVAKFWITWSFKAR